MNNLPSQQGIWKVIAASSVGTLIEWYDFYIFGSLATTISVKFFPPGNPTAAFLATLATFAAGFIVRPFGALVFGRFEGPELGQAGRSGSNDGNASVHGRPPGLISTLTQFLWEIGFTLFPGLLLRNKFHSQ